MLSRLQQEQRKAAGESLIVQFKPGIYMLKPGVDVTDAKETMAMHAPPEDEAPAVETVAVAPDTEESTEGEETTAAEAPRGRRRRSRRSNEGDDAAAAATDAPEVSEPANETDVDESAASNEESDEGNESDADDPSAEAGSNGDGSPGREKRKRRRGRRGGKNRQRTSTDNESSESDEAPVEGDAASTVAVADISIAPPEQRMPLQVRDPDDLSDVTRSLMRLMEKNPDNADSLRGLARGLSRARVGAIGKIGPAVIRSEIERANLLQSDHGRPPLFEEVKPDVWAVASASGSDLAASYAALEKWHQKHRKAVARSVAERVGALTSSSLATVITLLLDRMGYRDLKKHDPLSDEIVTISGVEPRALTSVNIAVRLLQTGKPGTREQVIAMRGSLHHFEASEGALISLSGFDKEATSEAAVANLAPITLIDAQTLIDHMVRCGVGVRNFNVAVACLDEPLFRDVVGD